MKSFQIDSDANNSGSLENIQFEHMAYVWQS